MIKIFNSLQLERPMNTKFAFFPMAFVSCVCSLVHAQSEFYRPVTPPHLKEGGVVGPALVAGREYLGSSKSTARILPSIDYQWRNGFFAGVRNGIGYNGSTQPNLAYGLRLTPNFGRKERRDDALRGLGDSDPRPEVGAFLNFSPMQNISLNSSLRYGSGNERNGLLIDVGAGWSTSLSPSVRLGTTLATTWMNADHAQEYFGISAEQSVRSGYSRFIPDAGFRDARLGVSVQYRIAPTWTLSGAVTHSVLLGDAQRSPIVRDKAATTAVLALAYQF